LNGKVVAAVLGVGPGLGAAIVRRFAREGFAVALMARNEDGLSTIRQELEDEGGSALPVSADATDPASVEAAFGRVRSELGAPEVFVYNAGAFQMGGILEIPPEKFDECFKANCAGALCTPVTNISSPGWVPAAQSGRLSARRVRRPHPSQQ
jgi:NAD(P)-dependent dehydrogenase (short-subunit alcohol dehydrogenase family)